MPKYYAVKARVAELLGQLGEGGALPTERDLAVRYGVSRETVRQALRELLLEGRLRRHGRGTVVAGPKLEQPLSRAGYTEGVRRQGRRPGRHLVALDRFAASGALAAELGAPQGEPVWHMERVLLAGDERVGLESTTVSPPSSSAAPCRPSAAAGPASMPSEPTPPGSATANACATACGWSPGPAVTA